MPKTTWSHKKKARKRKSTESTDSAEVIERSRMPDPNDPSICIDTISDHYLNAPVKTEVVYPNTRFQFSTTLFPSLGIEDLKSEAPSETFKRSAEDDVISTMHKKVRTSSSETTKIMTSDDCIIVENPPKQIKVEIVDLTNDLLPSTVELCRPTRIGCVNGLSCKRNETLKSINNVSVKVELIEKTHETSTIYKQSEDVNEVDLSSTESHARSHAQIKAEKNCLNESNSEVTLEKFLDSKISSIDLKSESNKEVERNVTCDENNKNLDSSFNCLSIAEIRNRIEKDTQKNSCGYQEPQIPEGIMQENLESYKSGTFRTLFLKYLNCNTKVDTFDLKYALSSLNSINDKQSHNNNCNNIIQSDNTVYETSHVLTALNSIEDTEEINENSNFIQPNVTTDSQDKFELYLNEKGEDLPNLESKKKHSLKNEYLNKILSCNTFEEARNSTLGVTNGASIRSEKSNNESKEQNTFNKGYLEDNPPLNNAVYSSSPRLTSDFSSTLQTGLEIETEVEIDSFVTNQDCSLHNVHDATMSFIYSRIKPTLSSSSTNSDYQSFTESHFPSEIAMEITQDNKAIDHFRSSNSNLSFENKHLLFSSSASENISSSMAQYNLHQSVRDFEGHQIVLPTSHFSGDSSSSSRQHNYLELGEVLSPMSTNSAVTPDYSSECIHPEFMLNPPLPAESPPSLPPLPPISPSKELPLSAGSTSSQSPLLRNHKKPTKRLSSELILTSLLPKHLKQDIGKNIIPTNDLHLVIIERNIDWILGIDKDTKDEYHQVQDSYENHSMYYNTYFPLLLLDCFTKISMSLKSQKREKIVCKIVQSETKQGYVSFTVNSFIPKHKVTKIPKEGHIILVKFTSRGELIKAGGVKMLGFVSSSGSRPYSHKHDRSHEIFKYLNVDIKELYKIKLTFFIVLTISGIDLNSPVEVSDLTSINKFIRQNDALKKLKTWHLCDSILNPRNYNFKSFTLPRRQDTNTMTTVVQEITQSLKSPSSQLIVIESAPFSDSLLAIISIVEETQKTNINGKILVCVGLEMLNQVGANLVQTSSNVVIINREKYNLSEKLKPKALDDLARNMEERERISFNDAKRNVLNKADIILVVTETCFHQDVKHIVKKFSYCIIHDAHSFTEPESLLPLMYGIKRLLLFGYHEEPCQVTSKRAASLGYDKSLFHRAYNLS